MQTFIRLENVLVWACAQRIVREIINDLMQRQGLGEVWVTMDPMQRETITERWTDLVAGLCEQDEKGVLTRFTPEFRP